MTVTVQVKLTLSKAQGPYKAGVMAGPTRRGEANKALHKAIDTAYGHPVPTVEMDYSRAKEVFSPRAMKHLSRWGFAMTRMFVRDYLLLADMGQPTRKRDPSVEGPDPRGVLRAISDLL